MVKIYNQFLINPKLSQQFFIILKYQIILILNTIIKVK